VPWRAGEHVVASMPVGFMAVDRDWRITYVTPPVRPSSGSPATS
jgi:hypothetical protein